MARVRFRIFETNSTINKAYNSSNPKNRQYESRLLRNERSHILNDSDDGNMQVVCRYESPGTVGPWSLIESVPTCMFVTRVGISILRRARGCEVIHG